VAAEDESAFERFAREADRARSDARAPLMRAAGEGDVERIAALLAAGAEAGKKPG